jgi:hypothetical protein
MTGVAHTEAGLRATDEAAGRQPGAILVNGLWRQVAPFSPAGNLLAVGATMQREATKPLKNEALRPGNLVAIGTRTVLEQPLLKGLRDTVEALGDPVRSGEKAVGATVGSFVPTAVSDVASLGDRVRRDPEGAREAFMARIPGLRSRLPEKRDVLGRPVEQRKTAAIDPTLASPARELEDPVARELVRNAVGVTKLRRNQGETREEHQARATLTGRLIETALREIVEDARYEAIDDREERKLILEAAVNEAQREVNALLRDERFRALGERERVELLRELVQ